MRHIGRVAFALFIALLGAAPGAHAEARIALLIGNEAYASAVGALTNPHNDVARLGAALQKIGFEVTTITNVAFGQLNGAVSTYARKLSVAGPGAIGFFYYSGHGAQNKDNGVNYLIPTDVKTVDAELWDYSVPLKNITDAMRERAPNATHFVVIDACRNSLKLKEPGSKALVQSKGFEPVRVVSGMLISYATAEGETASDVGAGAGPYSTALAEEIVKPGVEAVTMFRNVQLRVRAAINQEPWLSYGALNPVWFAGREEKPTAAAVPVPQVAPAPARQSEAAEAWDRAKDATSVAVLEAFIARFKDTFYADLARARIDELKRVQVSVVKVEPEQKTKRPDLVEQKALALERRKISLLMLTREVAQRVGQGLQELHDEIEDSRAKGTPLREIAEQLKLPHQDIEGIDRTGKTTEGKLAVTQPDLARLTKAVFDATVGLEQEPLNLSDGGYAWFDLIAVTEPRR